MKKFLVAFVLSVMLVLLFAQAGGAAALAAPDEGAVESQVLGEIEGLDKVFSGVEMWEEAKQWVVEHLSTVVGAIMALATFIIGLATKFSFMPKILTAFKTLFSSVKEWYGENIEHLKAFRTILDTFTADARGAIDEVKKQSTENNSIRNELIEVRKEYISLQGRNNALESALYSATLLLSDQFEDLIQASGLTKADADKHYTKYTEKKKLIAEALASADASVEKGVSEDV